MSAKPFAFEVQDVMDEAEMLRSQASKDWQQFYVAGRNATKKTMQKVYGLFYVVMHSDTKDKVIDRMKAKLPEKKVRENTKEAAIFIRYVFGGPTPEEGFDDKQVHVYSVALEVAFSKLIEPSGFIDWVDGHKGGFEGIRAIAAASKGDTLNSEPWELGMSWARGADAVETIKADDWDEDEPCRILVAMPNGDGTASVKDTEMTLEHVQAVLAIYSKAVAERNKPKGKRRLSLSTGEKSARTLLKFDLSYQEQLLEENRFNLSDAIKRNHMLDKEKAEMNLCLAKAKIVGIKASIQALGAAGDAE
ncbi:MAG: hypothetical protein A3E25_22405 [Burkholderiales bacterium RIFCSPHIGHO2_12_FULL_69_20]|nr:MAG: hypothetical protein A3E25_22405 [Burkholderiales bacterium RIFCSPHIGHO2_12_FULL_69_20]